MGKIGEWFWRFLAVVMLVAVGWVVWISYQLNPQPLVTMAAFEAAAKARASRNTQGLIAPAAAPAATPEPQPPKPEAATPEPKEPPVNLDKLKLSDTIATPIPEHPAKQ